MGASVAVGTTQICIILFISGFCQTQVTLEHRQLHLQDCDDCGGDQSPSLNLSGDYDVQFNENDLQPSLSSSSGTGDFVSSFADSEVEPGEKKILSLFFLFCYICTSLLT